MCIRDRYQRRVHGNSNKKINKMKTAFLVIIFLLSINYLMADLVLPGQEEKTEEIVENATETNGQSVLATYFTDSMGYRDNNLYDGNYWYAELSIDYTKKDFKALGNLPYKHKLRITYNGKSIIAMKGDVGAGGPNHPKIDLHKVASDALGFTRVGMANVIIENA
eukprot:TRINITY_DN173_c0_g1_i5.p1 TRINITY_DN173_c0_g1~~TRINITY_DN173_c0_g1_i5.p1  ORF type:complete len:165 (-),score=79.17 TRINITY_DN173_c0_g1_i5:106-600(-)